MGITIPAEGSKAEWYCKYYEKAIDDISNRIRTKKNMSEDDNQVTLDWIVIRLYGKR